MLTYRDGSSLFWSFMSVGMIRVAMGPLAKGLGSWPRNSDRMNWSCQLHRTGKTKILSGEHQKQNQGHHSKGGQLKEQAHHRFPGACGQCADRKPSESFGLDTLTLFVTLLLVTTEIQGPEGYPHTLLHPSLWCPSLSISPNCTFSIAALTCLAAGSCWGTCATPCPHRHWLVSPRAPCECWGQWQSCGIPGTGPGARGSLWKAESHKEG